MSSYIAPPFTHNPLDAQRLEGLFSFSNEADPLQRAEDFLSTDQQVKRRALFGLSNDALANDASNFIPEHLRSRLQKLAQHQADLPYQLTFTLEPEQAPSNNNAVSQHLLRSLSTKSDALPFLPNDQARRFTLPHAPLISVNMKNKIVSKVPSRRANRPEGADISQGSIKERWSLDDLEINISGIFLLQNHRDYPIAQIQSLYLILQRGQVGVEHLLLNTLGVTHLVVQSISLPPTKGNNQKYQIKALSDRRDYSLLEPNSA